MSRFDPKSAPTAIISDASSGLGVHAAQALAPDRPHRPGPAVAWHPGADAADLGQGGRPERLAASHAVDRCDAPCRDGRSLNRAWGSAGVASSYPGEPRVFHAAYRLSFRKEAAEGGGQPMLVCFES